MRIFFFIILGLMPIFILSEKTIADQKKNISSPYYDFKGNCQAIDKERPDLLCLPTSPITYDDLFSSKYLESKIQDINEWFSKNPFFGAKKVEARKKGTNSVGIFLKEDMDELTILYRFNEFDMITPFSISDKLLNSTKADDLLKLPPINFEEIGDLELAFATLMHLYWNKISEYRPLMRFFPEKIEIPAFTLTPYELELMKGDDSYEKALGLRKGFHESFKNFTRIINKHWNEDQREIFFRSYNPILEDFMYSLMLVSKYAWVEKEYQALQKKPHAFIPLGLFLFNSKSEEDGLSYRRSVEDKNGTQYIERVILATKNISKDYELSLNMGINDNEIQNDPNDVYFLMKNIIPDENTKDCVNLYIMEESLATSWGIPSITCFNSANKRLVVFHAVGNLMNMNDDQYQACKRIIDRREARVMNYEDEKLKVFQKCVHPPWKKFDIWERPLIELEEKTKMYENKIKKVKKYLKARIKYHLPTNNGELLKILFEKRLELCKELRKDILKIMESPKTFLLKDEL